MKHLKRINENKGVFSPVQKALDKGILSPQKDNFNSFQEEYDFIRNKLRSSLGTLKAKFGSFDWHSPIAHIEGSYTDNIFFDISIPKSRSVKAVERQISVGVILDTEDISYMSIIAEAIKSNQVLSTYKSVISIVKGDTNNIIRVIFYRKGKYQPK